MISEAHPDSIMYEVASRDDGDNAADATASWKTTLHSRWCRRLTAIAGVVSLTAVGVVVAIVIAADRSSSGGTPTTAYEPRDAGVASHVRVEFEPPPSLGALSRLTAQVTAPNVVAIVDRGLDVAGPTAYVDAEAIAAIVVGDGSVGMVRLTDLATGAVYKRCSSVIDPRCITPAAAAVVATPAATAAVPGSCDRGFYSASCTPCSASCAVGLDGVSLCDDGVNGSGRCTECRRGSFGDQCAPCPTCCTNARCDDGHEGSGRCFCLAGFAGDTCDDCLPGRYGRDCQGVCACGPAGVCDEGPNGTGACTCKARWAGARCDTCDVGWVGTNCSELATSPDLQWFNWCGPTSRLAAITFDAFPSARLIGELLESRAVATFFVSPGAPVAPLEGASRCALVQAALLAGHSVQSASFAGRDLRAMNESELVGDLDAAHRWIENCTGQGWAELEFRQLRPPMGQLDFGRAQFLSNLGVTIASYTLDLGALATAQDVVDRLNASVLQDASVIVRLDEQSADLPGVVAAVIASLAKYELVTSEDCYVACTGGAGVCRVPSPRFEQVFDEVFTEF